MSLHARYHDWARLLHASGTFHMHHKHVNTLDLPGRMLDGIIDMLKHAWMLLEVRVVSNLVLLFLSSVVQDCLLGI